MRNVALKNFCEQVPDVDFLPVVVNGGESFSHRNVVLFCIGIDEAT